MPRKRTLETNLPLNSGENVSPTMHSNKRTKTMARTPPSVLREKALIWGFPVESVEFAMRADDEDQLSGFRDLFCFPKKGDLPYIDKNKIRDEQEECLYLCGHSLGLKPKSTDSYVQKTLDNWGKLAVHSHFNGYMPAALSDFPPKVPMGKLVGAHPHEIAIMSGLTVNLHILLCTFFRPNEQRHKIMIEENAFSSDMYVVKSQLVLHGYSAETSLVTLKPRTDEYLLREEDILKAIEEEGDSVAVILLPGLQYYTGQFVNVVKLTDAAHKKGIMVGVDCAHAVGNVPLRLHDWNVDFAAWCTYKYLNSGAGNIGAIFVHERFTEKGGSSAFPVLKGWWGNNMNTKFLMKDGFDPAPGADMFRLSNPPPLLAATLMASLDIFSKTSMDDLAKKRFLLTGYLEYLINYIFPTKNSSRFHESGELPSVEIITPSDPLQRGAQLSISFSIPLNCVQEELQKRGVVCDIRMPSVMRVTPAPLYNSFQDVHCFVNTLKQVFDDLDYKFMDKCGSELIDGIESCKTSECSPAPVNISGSDSDGDSMAGSNSSF